MNISTTSPEILNTILFLAQGDNTEAMRIWRAPTPKEELDNLEWGYKNNVYWQYFNAIVLDTKQQVL